MCWKMERTRKSEVILEYCGMSLILSAGAWLLYWVPVKEPHAGSWPFLALLLVKLSAKSIKVYEVFWRCLKSKQHAIESRMQMALMSLWWHIMQPSMHVRRAASGELQLSFFVKNGLRGRGKKQAFASRKGAGEVATIHKPHLHPSIHRLGRLLPDLVSITAISAALERCEASDLSGFCVCVCVERWLLFAWIFWIILDPLTGRLEDLWIFLWISSDGLLGARLHCASWPWTELSLNLIRCSFVFFAKLVCVFHPNCSEKVRLEKAWNDKVPFLDSLAWGIHMV